MWKRMGDAREAGPEERSTGCRSDEGAEPGESRGSTRPGHRDGWAGDWGECWTWFCTDKVTLPSNCSA